jgi:hypothetical protein
MKRLYLIAFLFSIVLTSCSNGEEPSRPTKRAARQAVAKDTTRINTPVK